MAEIILMPRMSDTMTEGVIVAWHKKVGDKVKSGDLMAEVETDKATMELESYNDGTLLYIGVEAGKAVAVNGVLAIVGAAGEDYSALLNGAPKAVEATPAATSATETKTENVVSPTSNTSSSISFYKFPFLGNRLIRKCAREFACKNSKNMCFLDLPIRLDLFLHIFWLILWLMTFSRLLFEFLIIIIISNLCLNVFLNII